MSLNLVTAHTGTAHITAEQVASLIKGAISDDTANLYRFQTGNKCEYQITDALQVQILTGDAVFNGRHFIVEETETIDIDPASLNYARIDGVFLEIYSDNDTSEELIRFEVVQGNEYLISTGTPSYPATPTGIDDSHTLMYVFPWLYITTSYTTISTVEDNSKLYPNVLDITGDITGINSDISRITSDVSGINTNISGINSEITSMKETFQDGVDAVYSAVVAEGVTPSASTPTAIATAISGIPDKVYSNMSPLVIPMDNAGSALNLIVGATKIKRLLVYRGSVISGTVATVTLYRINGQAIASYPISASLYYTIVNLTSDTIRLSIVPDSSYASDFNVEIIFGEIS